MLTVRGYSNKDMLTVRGILKQVCVDHEKGVGYLRGGSKEECARVGEEESWEVLETEGSRPHYSCVSHAQFVAARMFEVTAPLTITYRITMSTLLS